MHPSQSGETCGPFFPNFRCSIFPPLWPHHYDVLSLINGTARGRKRQSFSPIPSLAAPAHPREVLSTSPFGCSLALLPSLFHAIIFRQGKPPGSPAHLEAPSNTTC